MEKEKIWQEAEMMLEEACGYSMRELMRNRESIEAGLKDKFSTLAILGEDCFAKVEEYIKGERPANSALSELCIRRHFIIEGLKSLPNEDSLISRDVCKAEKLWSIIRHKVLPMEIFWSMEYAEGNDEELTEEESEVLSYMKEIAFVYLDRTKALNEYAAGIQPVVEF